MQFKFSTQATFFCSQELTYLCNYGRMHDEEHLYEINLNLDQRSRRSCYLKVYSSVSSGGHFVQWRKFSGRHSGKHLCEYLF